jgi:hypothetical protein
LRPQRGQDRMLLGVLASRAGCRTLSRRSWMLRTPSPLCLWTSPY